MAKPLRFFTILKTGVHVPYELNLSAYALTKARRTKD
jgi:hypothetical protein